MFDETFRRIETVYKTSTGNQCAYFLAGHHGIASPVWEFPIGPESLEDLQHAEALEINKTQFPSIHAHWEYEARDCDSTYSDYGIYHPNADEYHENGEVNVFDFWGRLVENLIFAFAVVGKLKVESDPYEPFTNTFTNKAEWSESTEEGYRWRQVYLCTDECERPTNTFYDRTAQEAGY